MVRLINNYLHISPQVYDECLLQSENIFFVYYEAQKKIMIAPVSLEYFAELHKCRSTFLKQKNAEGERVFQIATILIDHNLNMQDRELNYFSDTKTNILTVIL